MNNIKIKENETFEEYKIRISNQSKSSIEKRGRKKGSEKLSKEKQLKILNFLKEHPTFYNLNKHSMWSSKSIQQLIQLKLNIYLPLSTIRDYLNKWFNTLEKEKGNRIKKLIDANCILKNTCNDVVTYLYIKKYKEGFIHIITRANENKFIYCGNKNQKNLIKTFKYLMSYYENIYLIFDSFFYDETMFNKLLKKNLKIFYINNTFKDLLINDANLSLIKEFKKETVKPIKNKKTNENKNLKIEKLDEIENLTFEEEFDEIENFTFEEELDLNNIKI